MLKYVERLRRGYFYDKTDKPNYDETNIRKIEARILADLIQGEIDSEYKPKESTTIKFGGYGPDEIWPAYDYDCQSCGEKFWAVHGERYQYCPFCGREIKEVDNA